MTTSQNILVVKNAYEAFRRNDIQAVLASTAEDVCWSLPERRKLVPFTGRFNGRSAVARFLESLASSEVELMFEPREFVAEGDSVVAFVHCWARARATGRIDEGEGVHLFRFRDGKIADFREFFDPAQPEAAEKMDYIHAQPADPVHCKFCN